MANRSDNGLCRLKFLYPTSLCFFGGVGEFVMAVVSTFPVCAVHYAKAQKPFPDDEETTRHVDDRNPKMKSWEKTNKQFGQIVWKS